MATLLELEPAMPIPGSKQTAGMSDFLCVGDSISLFCEETEGYVYSWQSSSTHNGLYIHQWQDREKPNNIPNPQAVAFQICIQNRYKLNKKYRKWLPYSPEDLENLETKAAIAQAKMAAEAENDDNIAEQRRQHGKRVRYGEVVQLKHLFTGKFIHVSTTQTSRRDKNNMNIHLQYFNAKHAQFRILPRYKVKSEGEVVQIYDQIVLESIKSPGQYFHSSAPYQVDNYSFGSELNLGVQQTGFTVVKYHRPITEQNHFVKGGSLLRLFHKELEAYLVAEGLFDDAITEGVHLRIREVDQLVPKSLYPSTSAITYWQIEAEASILKGDVIRWDQQVRFRNATTRQYLCINADRKVSLTPDFRDPRTVFKLHPVIKESDEIHFESYARIEHVLTGFWLHAIKEEEYVRQQFQSVESESSMRGLRWDGANLRKISASGEKMYDDAYTLQMVEKPHNDDFNFVAGMVPFLLNLIQDRKDNKTLNAKKTHKIITALRELKEFMIVQGQATKQRQKLLRNLRVIDLLVRLLQCPLKEVSDQGHLTRVFKEAYDVLYTYMIGNSRKNALYFAKYIDFFQTQISQKGELGLNVAQMVVELIRDNRKIVDRITHGQIDEFVDLLRQNKNYRYLDLLNVLCVCDGVAIPDNQTYITDNWLRRDRSGIFLTDRGQNINGQPNIIYVSTDNGRTWKALHEFVDRVSYDFTEEHCLFFEHQLDLYGKLCYGRNDFAIHVLTRELGILTWDEAFLCLRSNLLPDSLRAKYCELIIGLFIDVGTNYSVLDHTNLSFIYEDIGILGSAGAENEFKMCQKQKDSWRKFHLHEQAFQCTAIKDLVTLFPVLRDWISEFLHENKDMTASQIGHNMLIEQVLRLFHFLVKFGYYGNEDIKQLLKPLLNLLNGKNDKPFQPDTEKGFSKDAMKLVQTYKNEERYLPSPETKAIVGAKFQAMEVLDLLFTYQFNTRLEGFIAKFKAAETTAGMKKKHQSVLSPLLYETFDAFDQSKKALKQQKRALKELRHMFDTTAYFDSDQITSYLMDLSNYKYDTMISKSLSLLNKYYSAKTRLFKMAVQAQVLITQDSCHVHREIQRSMPLLRRYSRSKLNDEQVETMGNILDRFTEICHLPKEPEERHPMNQNILINHEVLTLVFDILSLDIDPKLMEQYTGVQVIMKKTLRLLKSLARGNEPIQQRIYERLDTLLKIKGVEADLAIALKEAFTGNQYTCLKVLPQQIQTIVSLAAEHQSDAPEFLDLLATIVKVDGLAIKRNQAYVMKYIMQSYNKVAYVLDQQRETREQILTRRIGSEHLTYLINLVDLLAACAEGENRFIESMCQTILSTEEILWVINHSSIDKNLKKPYLRYLLWVYIRTAGNAIESGAGDLPHDPQLWKYLNSLIIECTELMEFVGRNQDTTAELLKKPPDRSTVADPGDMEAVVHGSLHYFFEAVMPLLQAFFTKLYSPDKEIFPDEIDFVEKIAKGMVTFCEAIAPAVSHTNQVKIMIGCITSTLNAAQLNVSVMEDILEKLRSTDKTKFSMGGTTKGHKEYYAQELELNAKLRTFAVCCSLLYGGHNTVQAQCKFQSKREYTTLGGDEELPLGEEFQDHLKRFIRAHEKKVVKKFELAQKLVDQLSISASMHTRISEAVRLEQEELDIKCLQLLRAIIHNEERKLPEDWEENPSYHKKQLAFIKDIQIALNTQGAVIEVLPHLARPSDRLAKEVLAFVSIMLFNANHEVQSSLLDYFLHTREEVFFVAIRNRMHLSALAIKERRSLAAQHEARIKEALAQAKSMQSTMALGKQALQRRTSLRTLQTRATKKIQANKTHAKKHKKQKPSKDNDKKNKKSKEKVKPTQNSKTAITYSNGSMKDAQTLLDTTQEIEMETIEVTVEEQNAEPLEEEESDDFSNTDDGCIELVLRVLARMCDGQHRGLQDYLREQPDNMKSFNIVAETAGFLNLVYSNINPNTIDLVNQLFETVNEFTVGNQPNRTVLLNSKVIDYINFILRAGEFTDCTSDKVLKLRQVIANMLISLMEENSPEALQVAKEIKDTLDKEAVYRVMKSCYELHAPEKPKFEGLMQKGATDGVIKSAKGIAKDKETTPAMKETLFEVGFTYYLILARMYDIDPKLCQEDLNLKPEQVEAFNFYKKNSMSIEILKEDHLQKINFRVKNKNVLREEVKEKLKWNVDRSSPSNKIRDLMKWSKDILKDIYYQRKIQSNPLAVFFTKYWLMWNHACTLLSFAINTLMLVTWNARISLIDIPNYQNATSLPAAINDPMPNVTLEKYDIVIYAMGGSHNFFSLLVLISYFLSNHPSLPSCSAIATKFRALCVKQKEDDKDEEREHKSKLDVQFFSFKTFYYLMFLGTSVAGTVFQGYFFAFHLLNVVNNNQLLKGVIEAVTKNGKSLLWVAVLGFIVFYLYALISFALLRSSFNPEEELYCATLWQCTVTVIRYGLVGDIFENLVSHKAENTFHKFGFLVIFHLSFFIFITTIGLNIIFGIIVDTFSELRDLKWTAESDMRDTCFVCSRNSYDFEHHGLGFEHHVKAEHNMWAYIFFFIHLHDTKASDYTALELYVSRLLKEEKNDFFPLNRALCLSAKDQDSTESKVDELLNYVMSLVQKQKEEESERKRREEMLQQRQWREQHRNALLRIHDSVDSSATYTGGLNGNHGGHTHHEPNQRDQRTRQRRWTEKKRNDLMQIQDSVDTMDSNGTMEYGALPEMDHEASRDHSRPPSLTELPPPATPPPPNTDDLMILSSPTHSPPLPPPPPEARHEGSMMSSRPSSRRPSMASRSTPPPSQPPSRQPSRATSFRSRTPSRQTSIAKSPLSSRLTSRPASLADQEPYDPTGGLITPPGLQDSYRAAPPRMEDIGRAFSRRGLYPEDDSRSDRSTLVDSESTRRTPDSRRPSVFTDTPSARSTLPLRRQDTQDVATSPGYRDAATSPLRLTPERALPLAERGAEAPRAPSGRSSVRSSTPDRRDKEDEDDDSVFPFGSDLKVTRV